MAANEDASAEFVRDEFRLTHTRVVPGGVELCGWYPDSRSPEWIEVHGPAAWSWRPFLDLPTAIAEGLTLGEFIRLFDVRDRELDEDLFRAFTSLEGGPFGRWIAALNEVGFPPTPPHLVSIEISPVSIASEDRGPGGDTPLVPFVVSDGDVDDPFWQGARGLQWSVEGFPLAQVADLPLRCEVACTLRQLIQSVFGGCFPGNRTSDLTERERARGFISIEPCERSLEEMLGV